MPQAERFDRQAEFFDEASPLPPGVAEQVALTVRELARLGSDDVVLELGAGTGLIGQHLVRLPLRYVGLDQSRAMLDRFPHDARVDGPPTLVAQADCNQPWPLAACSVAAVFAARVLHLLDPQHVAREFLRVGRPGALLLAGRVQREPGSLRSRLRRLKRTLLAELGETPTEGAEGTRQALQRCVDLGAEPIEPVTVACWSNTTTADEILSGWEERARRGGQRWPGEPAQALAELRARAGRELGELTRPESYTESFTLQGVQLPQDEPPGRGSKQET